MSTSYDANLNELQLDNHGNKWVIGDDDTPDK